MFLGPLDFSSARSWSRGVIRPRFDFVGKTTSPEVLSSCHRGRRCLVSSDRCSVSTFINSSRAGAFLIQVLAGTCLQRETFAHLPFGYPEIPCV